MKTTAVTVADVTGSLMSVPPLARNADLSLNAEANRKLIAHIEAAGVTAHLYGGNANFYALTMRQYEEALDLLAQLGGPGSWIIPSIGPDFGKMSDQARIAKASRFPTFITLPQAFGTTPDGVAKGVRQLVDTLGRPIILYLKTEGYLTTEHVGRLGDERAVVAIKYGINRADSAVDPYLDRLVQVFDRERIIIVGERPAIAQRRTFKLGAMMSGSASVAPAASSAMYAALRRADYAVAEEIWAAVKPLEDLRDSVGPIPVLHDAVTLAGIADMGPVLPLVANVAPAQRAAVERAAKALKAYNDRWLAEGARQRA